MSGKATDWARRRRVGDPVAKGVLLYLAGLADARGAGVAATVDDIARVTECPVRDVRRALAMLEGRGLLRPIGWDMGMVAGMAATDGDKERAS